MMTVTSGSAELRRALTAVLSEGGWPIYRTEDDRGLEVDEYLDLFQNILSRLAAKPAEEEVLNALQLARDDLERVAVDGDDFSETIAAIDSALSTTGEPKR